MQFDVLSLELLDGDDAHGLLRCQITCEYTCLDTTCQYTCGGHTCSDTVG